LGSNVASSDTIKEGSNNSTQVFYRVQDPDGYSNLRKTPNGAVIKKVLTTEKFEVIGSDGSFKKVKLSDGTIGYIHESRLVEIK
jgi:hypothetical protein